MNVRHDDDFKISVNFVGEDGTPLNNSEESLTLFIKIAKVINMKYLSMEQPD